LGGRIGRISAGDWTVDGCGARGIKD
jgi:hypothetical protein